MPLSAGAGPRQRLDQWLWHARFFKTRSLAAKLVSEGKVRVDGARVSKPAHAVAPGATLTFPQARVIRVIKIVSLAQRRGPAPEAQALYEDVGPPAALPLVAPNPKPAGKPNKRERRKLSKSVSGSDC
ncbi:MAG: RNA-binding S4 domain-containing protein [Pseudomonadota bacterium]